MKYIHLFLSCLILCVTPLLAAAQETTPPPEPISIGEPVQSAQEIQQRLVNQCMARQDCRQSLLSDRSWLNGTIPEYDEATAVNGRVELFRNIYAGEGDGG